MHRLVVCLLLSVLCLGPALAQGTARPRPATSERDRMAKLMSTVTIPRLQVQEAPLRQVLDQVRHLAQLNHPDNERINLMYLGKPERLDAAITCEFERIPLGELIRYLCKGAGLKYRVEPHAIIIFDETVAMDEMQTRVFTVPPNSPILAPSAVR